MSELKPTEQTAGRRSSGRYFTPRDIVLLFNTAGHPIKGWTIVVGQRLVVFGVLSFANQGAGSGEGDWIGFAVMTVIGLLLAAVMGAVFTDRLASSKPVIHTTASKVANVFAGMVLAIIAIAIVPGFSFWYLFMHLGDLWNALPG